VLPIIIAERQRELAFEGHTTFDYSLTVKTQEVFMFKNIEFHIFIFWKSVLPQWYKEERLLENDKSLVAHSTLLKTLNL